MIGHYIMFNGNCAEALEVYKSAFGAGVVELQRYGDMPANPNFPISDEQKDLVLHAKVKIGDELIMCADASGSFKVGTNMYVSITTPNLDYVQTAWNTLKEGANIYMELAESFFAKAHGSMCDRFGVNWMFTVTK